MKVILYYRHRDEFSVARMSLLKYKCPICCHNVVFSSYFLRMRSMYVRFTGYDIAI